jgi:hypothetical protein
MDLVRRKYGEAMETMIHNAILNVTNAGLHLPEPAALLFLGTLMLVVGNLQRRVLRRANS